MPFFTPHSSKLSRIVRNNGWRGKEPGEIMMPSTPTPILWPNWCTFFLTTPTVFVFHCERNHRNSLPLVQCKIEYHGAYCTYVNIVTVKGLSRSRHGKIKEATISRMLNNICCQDKYTRLPVCSPPPGRRLWMNNLSKLVGGKETTRHLLRFSQTRGLWIAVAWS